MEAAWSLGLVGDERGWEGGREGERERGRERGREGEREGEEEKRRGREREREGARESEREGKRVKRRAREREGEREGESVRDEVKEEESESESECGEGHAAAVKHGGSDVSGVYFAFALSYSVLFFWGLVSGIGWAAIVNYVQLVASFLAASPIVPTDTLMVCSLFTSSDAAIFWAINIVLFLLYNSTVVLVSK